MSSAVVQSIPAQSQTLASPSDRQYSTAQDAQSAYSSQQISNQSSQDPSRRQSRKPSSRSCATSTLQSPYFSTTAPILLANTGDASTLVNPSSSTPHIGTSPTSHVPIEYLRGAAPTAPPRTSSYSDRTATDHSRQQSSMDQRLQDAHRSGEREHRVYARHTNGNHSSNVLPVRSISQDQVVPTNITSEPGVHREPSAVLNHVMVSQPEEDLIREQERVAESAQVTTNHSGYIDNHEHIAQQSLIQPPALGEYRQEPVVPVQAIRSRQDHSSSKKEKHTKFGDYFLGNTIGEGEFGKVKLGWKREGGVQVSIIKTQREHI